MSGKSGKIKLLDLQKDRFCGLFVLSAHLVYLKLLFTLSKYRLQAQRSFKVF